MKRTKHRRYMSMGDPATGTCFTAVGDPQDFYVWVQEGDREGQESGWIKGRAAFDAWHKLKHLFERNDKAGFVAEVKRLHTEFKKGK